MGSSPLFCPNDDFFGTSLDHYLSSRRTASVNHLDFTHKKVLDIGCGRNLPLFTARGPAGFLHYTGFDVDVNPKVLTSNAITINGNVETDPLPQGPFDVILALALIEHVHQPQKFVNKIKTSLSPDGTLILTAPTPRAKPILELLAFRLRLISWASISDHKRYFNKQSLTRLLRSAGFSDSIPIISIRL
jgi:2-polyprenyl-3-methyl-5-hydroxy-6-metoxy-1,4-benzoquinol methylase